MTEGLESTAEASTTARPRRDESLSRRDRLTRRADYLRCYRRGRRKGGPFCRLHWAPNGLDRPRLGITASRKVGRAVQRQRLRRQVREIFRRWPQRSRLPAVDLVVHLFPGAREASFDDLRSELERLLRSVVRSRR